MVIYGGLLIIFIFGILQSNMRKEQRTIIGLELLFFLIIIAGFRYDVGMDYPIYEDIYNDIVAGYNADTEIGFLLLCKFLYIISGEAQLMFLICSIVTLVLIYKSYDRFSPDIVMSLTIFLCLGQLYLTTFNAIRQCIAISVFSYSIKYIEQKSAIKYIIAIIIATLFHYTAILLVPLYWVLRVKYGRAIKIMMLIMLSFSASIIINIILNSPYDVYLQFDKFSNESSIINYVYMLFGLLIILLEPQIMPKYKDRNIFINISFLCTCLFLLNLVFSGTPLVMVVNRLNYYFICFYAVIFVRIIYDFKILRNRRMIESCLYIILFLIYIRTTLLLGESYHLVPYRVNFTLF